MMSQIYDKVLSAVLTFEEMDGAADTIILTPHDLRDLKANASPIYWKVDQRGEWFRGVRVMEGQPFDHSYVEGHGHSNQMSKILV